MKKRTSPLKNGGISVSGIGLLALQRTSTLCIVCQPCNRYLLPVTYTGKNMLCLLQWVKKAYCF